MSDQLAHPVSKSEADQPNDIIPVGPGYVCIPNETTRGRSNGPAPRLPVIGIAQRTAGRYQACVLDPEGRVQFSSGPVYVEGASHDETSSAKALQEISTTLKAISALLQKK
jgi:hypothetical protein